MDINIVCLRFRVRCLDDVDDEVRDRAAMYLKALKEPSLADAYVKEGMIFIPSIPKHSNKLFG